MKNLITILMVTCCCVATTNVFAQNKKVKRAEFNNLTKAGRFTEYVSKSGEVITVGDSLQIGNPSNFERYVHLTQNDAYLRADQMNKKIQLKDINVSGDDKKGYDVYFVFKGLGATPVFVKYEDALQTNEIKLLKPTTENLQE